MNKICIQNKCGLEGKMEYFGYCGIHYAEYLCGCGTTIDDIAKIDNCGEHGEVCKNLISNLENFRCDYCQNCLKERKIEQ